jgi:EmrB/QacA subfamily drug resistance transporter
MQNKINMDNNKVNKISILIVTTLGSFLTTFMSSSINIALPSIGKEFSIDAILLSWIATSYLLTITIFLVPFGRMADMYGKKKIFMYGIFIYSISSFFSAFSFSAILLIILRILQGVGGAMIFSTVIAILILAYPINERGKALGINIAATYLGLSLGPFLGGFLIQYFGWRSIFITNMFLGLIIIILTIWKIRGEWIEIKKEKFDFIGSIIYSLVIIAIIYGFSLLSTILGMLLVLIGVLGILIFIKWEKKVTYPVLNINLFKNNIVFTFSNIAALINYSATFAVSFLLSLYLQYIKGFDPQNAGLILVSQPIVQAIFSPFAGKLSDKIEPRIIASIGMMITTIGLYSLIFLNEKTFLEFIIASLILLGFGFALFSSPNTNAIMSSVERKFYGVASAILATMRSIGQTFSMGISTLIFTIYIGNVQITQEYYPFFLESIKVAFTIFSFLCFIGIFASLARGKLR